YLHSLAPPFGVPNNFSFPRSAWERTSGRSASRPAWAATQSVAYLRSHAERGNESRGRLFPPLPYGRGSALIFRSPRSLVLSASTVRSVRRRTILLLPFVSLSLTRRKYF